MDAENHEGIHLVDSHEINICMDECLVAEGYKHAQRQRAQSIFLRKVAFLLIPVSTSHFLK